MTRQARLASWAGLALVVLVAVPPIEGRRLAAPIGATQGPQTPAVVLGRVVDGDTGEPVGGASVELRPTAPLAAREATKGRFVLTDGNGRFVFPSVDPGGYGVFVLMAGRIPAQYGQRRPRGPGDQVTIATTPPVTDLTIRMWRFGAIEGVVRDEAGEPAVGVPVHGAHVIMAGGRRMLATEPALALTDDRGVYRLASLSPGQYYVFVSSTVESVATSTARSYEGRRASPTIEAEALASLRESRAVVPSLNGLRLGDRIISWRTLEGATAPTVSPDGRLEVHPTVFSPSARTLDRATPVTVTAGETHTNVNVQLTTEVAVEVSGTVNGPDGPAAGIGVRIVAADIGRFASDAQMETAATTTDAAGRFALPGVPPGQYSVKVMRVARPPVTTASGDVVPSSADAEAPTLWAEQALTVGDQDVGGVSLQLRRGARVTGRIQFEGASPAPASRTFARFMVRLTPVAGQQDAAFLRPPNAREDGTFRTMSFPPGRYFIDVLTAGTPGPRRFIKSIAIAGRDYTDRPIELGSDDVTGVVVTMTDRLGGVSGSVSGAGGVPTEALVVAFPADYRGWVADGMPASRTGTTNADAGGRFTIANLRPGAYLAVALPVDSDPDLQDPDLAAELARLATEVHVNDSGAAPISLSIVSLRGR